MSKIRIIVMLMFLSFIPISNVTASTQGLFAPAKGKTLLFIGQDGDTIKEYSDKINVKPTGVMFYTSVQRMEGLDHIENIGAGPQHADGLLKDYPDAVIQIGLYMVEALDGIAAGEYDANLTKFANWIIKANRPVYIRIGYEFDNPDNRYDPVKYKKAYTYIVDFLRKNKVSNAAYVWHSYTAEKLEYTWESWYPGDDYVDWFASSIFTTGNIPYAAKFNAMSRAHHKPFMIAESTPRGMFTVHGKRDWFNHVFRFIEQNNIAGFSYINSNWDVMPMYEGQGWGDARIETDKEIEKLWLDHTKKSRYLKSSSSLFHKLGFRN